MQAAQSLYVHVPFCVVKCGYCDFNSFANSSVAEHDRFLAALRTELRLKRTPRVPTSVFIGGGTPTYLDPARLCTLFEVLRDHVDLDACPEVTVEANPESTTIEKARLIRAAGVNRVSIGAQSFAQPRLRFLDRAHDGDATRRAVEAFRAAGFANLSLDLIYGLPGQTLPEWMDDLEQALALNPDHLSCYQLTYELGTRLRRELDQGRITPNPEHEDRDLFVATRSVLASAGFSAYEVSNFAGRGGPCRHNDHYWLQGDYVGVGPGACSHRNGLRSTNLKPPEAWALSVERGLLPTGESEWLTPGQRTGEALWLGLRRSSGVDLVSLRRRLEVDPVRTFGAVIAHYTAAGLLDLQQDRLALTERGLLFADTVGAAFLA